MRRGIAALLLIVACSDDGTAGTGTEGDAATAASGPEGTDGADTADSGAATSESDPDGSSSDGDEDSDATVGGECEDPADWLDRPLAEQVAALESGQLCCTDLTAAYLDRIASIDEGADEINAMLAVDERAETWASALDASAGSANVLQCALIGLKDNIDAEGLPTTAGSLAMVDNVVAVDSPVAAGLRGAGALLIGKTNLSEWANFRGDNSTSGWSSFGGQTKNGADPGFNPCGSSSGSGAAVAAGVLPAAIGTETSGSIVCPSSQNGVVGFKPTVGLVSRSGIIPISHSHDTAGPMTRTVRDAALVLGAIAGPDPNDPATADIPADTDFDFVAQLDDTSLQGARLGYSPGFTAGFGGAVSGLFDTQRAALEAAGAEIVEIQLPNTAPIGNSFTTVLITEFKADLNAYLADHAGAGVPADLAALIDFNNANAAEVMPHFGQEWFERAQATSGLTDPTYLNAVDQVASVAGTDGLLATLDDNDLDAIIGPTTGPAWITNYQTGDQGGPSSAFLPAAAGYPHLTVPMGAADGRPVGISFIGRPWEDASILSLGHAYEQI